MLNKLLLFLFLAFLSSQSGQGSLLAPLCFELLERTQCRGKSLVLSQKKDSIYTNNINGNKKEFYNKKTFLNVPTISSQVPNTFFFFICPFSLPDLDHCLNNLCYCHRLEYKKISGLPPSPINIFHFSRQTSQRSL